MIATLQLALLVLYHLPQALIAQHPATWPDDVAVRTYFTHGVCGPALRVLCP